MNSFRRGLVVFFSPGAFSGSIPVMPGTAGTIAAIPLFLLISLLPISLYLIITLLFVFFAVWISGNAERIFKKHDPPEVVIDEIAGYLIAMATFYPDWKYIVAGFVLFRIMDIIKPYPANRINDNLKGGQGIVLDDVVAGIYANLILQATRALI